MAALARSATGSFRDALGTLEQLVTYSGTKIALEDVLAVLGVADAGLLEATVDAVAAGDAARGAARAGGVRGAGPRRGRRSPSELEARARELLVVQVLGEVPAELSLTPEADAALAAQAERVEHATVVRLLELLGEAMEAVRAGADARTRLELALVKAARPEVDSSMRALLARIERLEGRAANDVDERPPPAAGMARATQPPASLERSEPDAEPVPVSAARDPEPAGARDPEPATAGATGAPAPGVAAAAEPATAGATGAPAPGGGADAGAEPATARGLDSVSAAWPAVVDLVRSGNGLLGACLVEAQPVAVDGQELTLGFASSARFHKKKAEDPAHRAALGEALRAVTGERWQLRYELREELAPQAGGDAGERSQEDWVARFMQEFDAEELTEEEQAVTSNEKGS